MRRTLLVAVMALLAGLPAAAAQTKKPVRKPATRAAKATAPALPQRIATPASIACPHVLGTGVGSKLQFCDVWTGRNPAEGILIRLPAHKGPLTLTFDLHNRHTYSEDLVKTGKGYANYTATIGVLASDGALLSRAVARSEFRTARDLLDRISGGADARGVKAIAPVGVERVSLDVPEAVQEVSLLGEKLTVLTLNGTETYTATQRPIAVVSNINIDYRPAAKPPARKTPVRKRQ